MCCKANTAKLAFSLSGDFNIANKDSPFYQKQEAGIAKLKEEREAILEVERLKARSIAARDVGDSKQKIEDRAGAGGMDKERQIIAATEKLKADIKYTQALATANEIGRIELEAEKQKEEKEGAKTVRSERYCGKIFRSFTLDQSIDQATAVAKYEDGVLELTLPKKPGNHSKLLKIS